MTASTFPQEVTEEEADAGFRLEEIDCSPSELRVRAVVVQLAGGLRAIKMVRPPSDAVEYAIWDQRCISIYRSARTLTELFGRFPNRIRAGA